MYKLVVIVGPTAVGKSSTAVTLAKDFKGEVINGDSIQVYRQLAIGSAKTTEAEMQGVPHHLIDYKDVNDEYRVQLFQKDGRQKIEEIVERGHLPIIAGGTGLYIKALLYDYSFTEMEANHEEYEDISTAELYERLKQLDPKSVEKIHPNNRRRIVRALQMADSGHLKSEQEAGQNHAMLYDCKIIGLTIDREQLRERIGLRVDKMMEAGLLEEVRGLKDRYGWDNQAMKAIGYKEFKDYFSGNISLEEAVESVKVHTRQFAKRQYTWWNNQMPVSWFDISEPDYLKKIEREIKDWLC